MSWIKENKQAAVTIGVGGILTIALVGFGLSLSGAASEAKMEYQASLSQVKNLEKKPTTPEKEQVGKLSTQVELYSNEVSKLKEKLIAFGELEIEAVQPSEFQAKLTAAVNDFKEQAAERGGVIVPEDFYMGFEAYRGTLPKKEAAGALAYELEASSWLFSQMLDLGLKRVISVARKQIEQEKAEKISDNDGFYGLPMSEEPLSVLDRMPLEVVVEINKAGWPKLLSLIASPDAKHFIAIRGLRVINEKTNGPSKDQVKFDEVEEKVEEDSSPFGGFQFDNQAAEGEGDENAENEADPSSEFEIPGEASGEEIVKPVLGTESIYLALQLEVIHFKSEQQIPGQSANGAEAKQP